MNDETLSQLNEGDRAAIIALKAGAGMQHRLRSLGLKEGKTLCVVARHHFSGPLVVEIDRRQVTIGRGMARGVIVARAR